MGNENDDKEAAVLTFVDSDGIPWRVWATHPELGSAMLSRRMAGGWLTFDTLGERRRLAPIPDDWEGSSPEQLEGLCRRADKVRISGPHRL